MKNCSCILGEVTCMSHWSRGGSATLWLGGGGVIKNSNDAMTSSFFGGGGREPPPAPLLSLSCGLFFFFCIYFHFECDTAASRHFNTARSHHAEILKMSSITQTTPVSPSKI